MTDLLATGEDELAAALVDAEEAKAKGVDAAFLLRRVDELRALRAEQRAAAEEERLRAGERARREKQRSASDELAKESDRRDQVARLVQHRWEVAQAIDDATNALATLVGAYRSDTEQLEVLDRATPWAKHVRRLAEWMQHRLGEVTGRAGGFERALTASGATWAFTVVEAELTGATAPESEIS